MNFLFSQAHPFERLQAVRLSLTLIVVFLLLLGPYDSFYVESTPWLYRARFFPNLGIHFYTLKWAVIATALAFGSGLMPRVSGVLFALLFLAFNFYTTCFQTSYWVTNTHLNFFAIALAVAPFLNPASKRGREAASFLLAFMINYIATLYLQAGVSKCLWGGIEWFTSGLRPWSETCLLGTPFGKWLTQWPWLFCLMGLATFFVELINPFLFFFRRTQKLAAITALSFHLGTFIVMGISFWHLWALYPALFFKKWGSKWGSGLKKWGSKWGSGLTFFMGVMGVRPNILTFKWGSGLTFLHLKMKMGVRPNILTLKWGSKMGVRPNILTFEVEIKD